MKWKSEHSSGTVGILGRTLLAVIIYLKLMHG